MAINKKGSRKIVVDSAEFRWRATGNDGWITIVIWPAMNDESKVIGHVGYHAKYGPEQNGVRSAIDQIVITNRMVREIILHIGVGEILENKGQLDIGAIENIFDMDNAVRGVYGQK